MSRKYKCQCCKELIEDESELLEIQKEYKTSKLKLRYHKSCYEQMRKDKDDWDKLYDYVRYNILNMPEGRQLSKTLSERLQSLRFGEYQIKGRKETQVYTYEQMYYTFVICRTSIQQGLKFNKINKDVDISNYIMAIIMNNINDVANRIEDKKKSDEKLNEITQNINTTKYEYIKQENNKVGKLLDNLW